jgi:hypothetical protein
MMAGKQTVFWLPEYYTTPISRSDMDPNMAVIML